MVPDILEKHSGEGHIPGFLPSLARLEWALHHLKTGGETVPKDADRLRINPTVRILELPWKNLPLLIHDRENPSVSPLEPGEERVLVWREPGTNKVRFRAATDEDLLALKMVAEQIPVEKVASMGTVLPAALQSALERAVNKGLLLSPPSRIRRDPGLFKIPEDMDESFLSPATFHLQWHVTQACDLHCKHCYDRSDRSPLRPDHALRIMDEFQEFCENRNVRGYISFTGGNPLLYPYFKEVYRAASERGFLISLLGNPAPRGRIEELLAIQPLERFQISLEGLPEHNDDIRGTGHFQRSMDFLEGLKDLGVYSMVMLTLTADNMDQVLPLAGMLGGRVDSFTFNRLSQVGEGADLKLPTARQYALFLQQYLDAAEENPVLRLKDNLFNILLLRRNSEPFGGCTGFGCGAAFNFLTLLADGEVHACRKFPSFMGNAHDQGISDIYDSEIARRYRAGSLACRKCSIRPVCGGCMAVVHGHGLDVFHDRDPFCFMNQK
jgi:selenobiotic family peptide radical SAM maturase